METGSTSYVFRVLREDENITDGIIAKNIYKSVKLADFHRLGTSGKIQSSSQFIATTNSFAVAYEWAKKGKQRIAVIRLSEDSEYYDCSSEEKAVNNYRESKYAGSDISEKPGYYKICANYAQASKEVDVVMNINRSDFVVYEYHEIRKIVRSLWDNEKTMVQNMMLVSNYLKKEGKNK